jgi:hypothetical protein
MSTLEIAEGEEFIWGEVWSYLLSTLANLSEGGKQKLRALAMTPKGKLCATCLAIDLRSGAIRTQEVSEIFENVRGDDVCSGIAKALSEEKYDNLICCSLLESPVPKANDAYVTVMEIATFIYKFVRPNTGEGFAPEEVKKILDTYFDDEGDLSALIKCDLQPSGRLWVLPRSEYSDLLERANRGKSARVFLDALGLTLKSGHGVNGLPFLVAILHPEGHDCGAKQPTSWDVWWANTHIQFISFRRVDGWGRTFSCTGMRYFESNDEGMPRERVHRDSHSLSGFTGRIIGGSPPVEPVSQDEVFRAALKRFAKAWPRRAEGDDNRDDQSRLQA